MKLSRRHDGRDVVCLHVNGIGCIVLYRNRDAHLVHAARSRFRGRRHRCRQKCGCVRRRRGGRRNGEFESASDHKRNIPNTTPSARFVIMRGDHIKVPGSLAGIYGNISLSQNLFIHGLNRERYTRQLNFPRHLLTPFGRAPRNRPWRRQRRSLLFKRRHMGATKNRQFSRR